MGLPVKCNRGEREIRIVRIVVVDVAISIDVPLVVVVTGVDRPSLHPYF